MYLDLCKFTSRIEPQVIFYIIYGIYIANFIYFILYLSHQYDNTTIGQFQSNVWGIPRAPSHAYARK